ncbi:inositol monophosphatase [Mycolicibacterium celeriflavum]|uniref:Inositol-1-monophosphatase n=1 Tax=Mycolicibacterium celeriflavum TaxID=1249101 RepID=A0A1X0C369_MYCCF|nr:inositol monophosphatase family protein [Mycolicibacterium celeriflavum]MCV7239340.1 inositol monophosphatase [Mycolicibacterium celeriflavum]OBG22939.1 inositol monophosphatase [Mycolicibacterium celeriflavum]ORA51794.1 inositol monophosphatase [Mycolicibacterium celeriflavum]BBY43032.1 inositol monophosphatase [Mycolicibacterium celeriflavum]
MPDNDADPVLLRSVAEQLATEAAAFVLHRRAEVFGDAASAPETPGVWTKSSPTDPVTIVDTETERLIRDRLAVLRPGEHVLGEEEGGAPARPGELTWVLDPIDGTVNFVYGLDAYAVSVAVQRDGVSLAGAVANVPTGAVYSAAVGHGAHRRHADVTAPLRTSSADDLSMSLLGTGFSYDREQRARQAEVLTRMLPAVRDVRRIGSCALDLCMVAAGQLDAYYEDGVHLWDWAAGALIAAEAGATLRLPPGEGSEGGPGFIVAAAPAVAADLDAALRRAGAP